MYRPRNIVRFNNYYLSRLEEKNKKTRDMLHYLNFVNRKIVFKVDNLIIDLYRQIEKDTGWLYMHPYFVFNSDFKYENEDITFFINKVDFNEDGYVSEHDNDREKSFIENNSKLLTRLHKLETFKNSIYERNKELIKEKKEKEIIDIRFQRDIVWNDTEDYYMEFQGEEFVKRHGIDGIRRLIKLLNDLSNNPNYLEVYNNLRRENISNLYISELLSWASSYSVPAQNLLNKFNEDRQKNIIQIEVPKPKYREEENIIKLMW